MALKQLYDAKIVQLHLLNRPATGDLSRVSSPCYRRV